MILWGESEREEPLRLRLETAQRGRAILTVVTAAVASYAAAAALAALRCRDRVTKERDLTNHKCMNLTRARCGRFAVAACSDVAAAAGVRDIEPRTYRAKNLLRAIRRHTTPDGVVRCRKRLGHNTKGRRLPLLLL